MTDHEYKSTDPESQVASDEYHNLLDSINRRMDPDSNTVLLVDDERAIRRRVARDITKNDDSIVVHEAANGQEALERLAEIREKYERDPLFIVLDLNMPIMDGWEVIAALKKDYEERGESKGIPIIVLSSTSGEKGFLFKKSVFGTKSRYTPIVAIAKEACINPSKYDATGEKGLMAWIKYFLRAGSTST